MAQEIELKLVVTTEAAAVLARDFVPAEGTDVVKQHAVYFDTPDHRLFEQGASLRIRRSGRKRVQTVKLDAAKGAGLFARPEWEQPVRSDVPVLDATTPIAAMLGEQADMLAPVFTVAVERLRWLVETEEAAIELVLDRGSVTAEAQISHVCEVELELKRGDPAALFALARRIGAIVPVRLGVLTKSERGYALLAAAVDGSGPDAVKAGPVSLDRAMTTADAFQAIVRACLRQYRLNETILLETRAPEALHQARVALRRLRSALRIFTPLVGKSDAARFSGELRWLAQVMGTARDLDVLAKTAAAADISDIARDRIATARHTAYDAVEAALQSPRVLTTMLDLMAWTTVGLWLTAADRETVRTMPARRFAAKALRRRRKAVKTGGTSLKALPDEDRHAVRKAAKTLRYAAEFFAGLFDGGQQRRRHAAFVSALEKLQDRLGTMNDVATRPALLARLDLCDTNDAGVLLAPRRPRKRARAAARAHDALLARKRFWR